jgi:hypothetical protein
MNTEASPKWLTQIVEQTSRFTHRVVSTTTYENRTHSELPVPDFAYSGLGAGLTRKTFNYVLHKGRKQAVDSVYSGAVIEARNRSFA